MLVPALTEEDEKKEQDLKQELLTAIRAGDVVTVVRIYLGEEAAEMVSLDLQSKRARSRHKGRRRRGIDLTKFGGKVIQFNVDANLDENNQRTALMIAAQCNNLDVLRFLVEPLNCDINARDKYGMTAMHRAAASGCLANIKYLCSKGGSIELLDEDGRTSCMIAAERGHMSTMKYLFMKEGPEAPQADKQSLSLPMIALSQNHYEVGGYSYLLSYPVGVTEPAALLESIVASITEPQHAVLFFKGALLAVRESPFPLSAALRYTHILLELSSKDATLRETYRHMADQFVDLAYHLWDEAVHRSRHPKEENKDFSPGLILEQRFEMEAETVSDRRRESDNIFAFAVLQQYQTVNQKELSEDQVPMFGWKERTLIQSAPSVLDIALNSQNVDFVRDPRLGRIVERWWTARVPAQTIHSYHKWTHEKMQLADSIYDHPHRMFRTPKFKYILDIVSYFLFLGVAAALLALHVPLKSRLHPLECLLGWWGIAYFVSEVRNMSEQGFHTYWADHWNRIDMYIPLNISLCGILRLVKWSSTTEPYIIPLYTSLVLLLAMAMFARALFAFALSETMGPLLIAIENMLTDVFNFAVLFSFFLFAFFFSFLFITGDLGDSDKPVEYQGYGSLMVTLIQVGWAGDPLNDFHQLGGRQEVFAQIMSSAYVLISGVVLVNLLIAMMGSTYDKVRSQAASEFLFLRVKIRWQYDQSRNHLPPPLNVVCYMVFAVVYVPLVVGNNLLYRFGMCRRCRNRDDDDEKLDLDIGLPSGSGRHRFSCYLETHDYCAYCHTRWQLRMKHRYYTLYTATVKEMVRQGTICGCGRMKRLVNGETYVLERFNLWVFTWLIYNPLLLGFRLLRGVLWLGRESVTLLRKVYGTCRMCLGCHFCRSRRVYPDEPESVRRAVVVAPSEATHNRASFSVSPAARMGAGAGGGPRGSISRNGFPSVVAVGLRTRQSTGGSSQGSRKGSRFTHRRSVSEMLQAPSTPTHRRRHSTHGDIELMKRSLQQYNTQEEDEESASSSSSDNSDSDGDGAERSLEMSLSHSETKSNNSAVSRTDTAATASVAATASTSAVLRHQSSLRLQQFKPIPEDRAVTLTSPVDRSLSSRDSTPPRSPRLPPGSPEPMSHSRRVQSRFAQVHGTTTTECEPASPLDHGTHVSPAHRGVRGSVSTSSQHSVSASQTHSMAATALTGVFHFTHNLKHKRKQHKMLNKDLLSGASDSVHLSRIRRVDVPHWTHFQKRIKKQGRLRYRSAGDKGTNPEEMEERREAVLAALTRDVRGLEARLESLRSDVLHTLDRQQEISSQTQLMLQKLIETGLSKRSGHKHHHSPIPSGSKITVAAPDDSAGTASGSGPPSPARSEPMPHRPGGSRASKRHAKLRLSMDALRSSTVGDSHGASGVTAAKVLDKAPSVSGKSSPVAVAAVGDAVSSAMTGQSMSPAPSVAGKKSSVSSSAVSSSLASVSTGDLMPRPPTSSRASRRGGRRPKRSDT